ncbi:XisH family protein [Anabaena azotica]|uniref:XisH family protein n=1 Tax=Anabaena azotica TaxID=197653 RepID=UPI001F557971|nr:XisH family protein [Anabaena azotica]
MPKLDIIHNAVKNALIKDGWAITHDPYVIQYRRTTLYADLGADRAIAAQRDEQKLVVEVKSFISASKIQDLKEALVDCLPIESRKGILSLCRELSLAQSYTGDEDEISIQWAQP